MVYMTQAAEGVGELSDQSMEARSLAEVSAP